MTKEYYIQNKLSGFTAGWGDNIKHPIFHIFFAISTIIVNVSSYSILYNYLVTASFTLPLYAIILSLLYKKTATFTKSDIVTLLYSLNATIMVTHKTGANGWVFFFFIFLCLIKSKRKMMLLFSTLLIFQYWTISTFMIIFITIKILNDMASGKKITYAWTITSIYFLYMLSNMYNSTSRFYEVVQLLHDFSISQNKVVHLYIGLSSTSALNKIKVAISSTIGLSPMFFWILFRYYNKKDIVSKHINIYYISIIAFSILYTASGLSGFGRILEYGGYLSVIMVVSNIKNMRGDKRRLLIIICIIASSLSIISYVTDENMPIIQITKKEASGNKWFLKHNKNNTIFTDHRIGGNIASHGYPKVTGIYGTYSLNVLNRIADIYYNEIYKNAKTALNEIKLVNNENIELLLLSDNMINDIPGITSTGYVYSSPPHNFKEKYSSNIDKIYDNDESHLFNIIK